MNNIKGHNILFIFRGSLNPERSGVARVNNILAIKFNELGAKVYGLADENGVNSFTKGFTFPAPFEQTKHNYSFLESLCVEYSIDTIVLDNLAYDSFINMVAPLKGKVKLIGHLHNAPTSFFSKMTFLQNYKFASNKYIKTLVFKFQTARHRKLITDMMTLVDNMVLLSPSYLPELRKITNVGLDKVISIYNPFLPVDYSYNKADKKKQILYVGRINEEQKRITSLLRIWGKISPQLPDWNLCIVGGGKDYDFCVRYARKLSVKNCSFEGYQTPIKYYQESSIFAMTSNYEGFPMTLVESMQYGCIPIVFASFACLPEIIDNGQNGFIIPAFNEIKFGKVIVALAQDGKLMDIMAESAICKSKVFSADKTVQAWNESNIFNKE